MKSILLIRHALTKGNQEKLYIGRTDQPLCPEGLEQARNLALTLAPVDMVFSSPMLRCLQTAAILFPQQDIEVIDDLRECDFGIFEGKSASELADDLAYREWLNSGCTAPIPGGEDVSAFKNRTCKAFLEVTTDLPENTLTAFVVHGGSIMSIMEAFAFPQRKFHESHLGNCQYVRCDFKFDQLLITGGSLC